ncbi:MAG: putative 2-dehydropantoate 2-reductase [Chroococcus sp. CMT-3BRIN-NPC107]|jgi:2-dehydropantoate 2-reductase|nr:putative 2-dehydropantoate 2-reductase [Chroococcus sp. CMT-3BRIN-NPC107]
MSSLYSNQLTYAILGTGALGGYYGACLQRAGKEVHFLLHSDYDRVKEHGLVIESAGDDFALPQVHAYDSASTMPKCDVVVVALKTTQNHLLPQLLPPVVKDDGVVLVLQNGLGIEQEVAQIVGNYQVMGGLCFLCSNKVGAGHIRHLDYKEIKLGEYTPNYQPGGISERMQSIGADFEKAGIPIQLSADLLLARWQKLVWNIPYNGLSVILNATTSALMADINTLALIKELMNEVVTGAKTCDRLISDSFIDEMLNHTAKMKPYRTSMKIDYDEKRVLEVEAIFGNPLRMVQEKGIQLPRIATLYQQLKFLDAKNRIKNKD